MFDLTAVPESGLIWAATWPSGSAVKSGGFSGLVGFILEWVGVLAWQRVFFYLFNILLNFTKLISWKSHSHVRTPLFLLL
jgi:hypothetical protein